MILMTAAIAALISVIAGYRQYMRFIRTSEDVSTAVTRERYLL